ncbi:MAG: SIMPL domain-containing protein [Pseudomonadota bacterium]
MPKAILHLSAVLAATALLTACGNSAQMGFSSQVPHIAVVGEGEETLEPDMATLTLGVVSEAEEADDALEANSMAMGMVMEAMEEEGVDEADLRTSNFSIQPKYVYPKNQAKHGKKPRIVGYTVRNTLTVTVRDLDDLGDILQKSVELGINEGGNIQFGNAEPEAAISLARQRAMLNAVAKARTLADAANVDLGPLLQVSEQQRSPRPMARGVAMMAADAAAESVPVAAGENVYRVTVNVNYGIDQ